MDRLHAATEQFTAARKQLDGVVESRARQDGSAGVTLRAAEKELEAVTAEINKCLSAAPAAKA
jgi:hypothetical protein